MPETRTSHVNDLAPITSLNIFPPWRDSKVLVCWRVGVSDSSSILTAGGQIT